MNVQIEESQLGSKWNMEHQTDACSVMCDRLEGEGGEKGGGGVGGGGKVKERKEEGNGEEDEGKKV